MLDVMAACIEQFKIIYAANADLIIEQLLTSWKHSGYNWLGEAKQVASGVHPVVMSDQ